MGQTIIEGGCFCGDVRYRLWMCCWILIGATPPSDSLVSPTVASLIRIVLITIGLIVFLILSAFYSGSETALVSLDKVRMDRLAEEGNKRAHIIKHLLKKPERVF